MLDQDNPVQLDDAERALLAAYRTETRMPPAARERMLGRLERPRPAPVARPTTNPWVWVGALAAAAIVVVLVARNLESSRASQQEPRDGSQAAMPSTHDPTQGSVRPSEPQVPAAKRRPDEEPAREPEAADLALENPVAEAAEVTSERDDRKAPRKRRVAVPEAEPEPEPEPELEPEPVAKSQPRRNRKGSKKDPASKAAATAKKPEPPAAKMKVSLRLKAPLTVAYVKIAGKQYVLEPMKKVELPVGTHKVLWRPSKDQPYVDGGSVKLKAGGKSTIRITSSGARLE